MIIEVRVIPRAKKNAIEQSENGLRLHTTALPESGKANSAVIKLLSEHFKTAKSNIKIIKGDKSRNKTFEIKDL